MAYETVFDVSQRLPQLALGVAGAAVLIVVILVGLLDIDALLPWWRVVLGLAATLLIAQWLVVGAWPYALAVVVAMVVLAVIARVIDDLPPESGATLPRGSRRTIIATFMLVFVALQGLPMVKAIDLVRRENAGEAVVVEGPVRLESFGKTECMTVADRRTCYQESVISPGWNRMRYLVGGLHDGQMVRLSFLDDLIVRVEAVPDP